MAKKSKSKLNADIVGRKLQNPITTAYAECFREIDKRYSVPKQQLSGQFFKTYPDDDVGSWPWQSFTDAELFVRVLFNIHEDIANTYLITQDISATIAIVRLLDGKIEDWPSGDEVILEIKSWHKILVKNIATDNNYAWFRRMLKQLVDESEFIEADSSMMGRFKMVRESWYKYHDEGCKALLDRMKKTPNATFLVRVLNLLSDEYMEQLKLYEKIKVEKLPDN